jgi:hypothetical protein
MGTDTMEGIMSHTIDVTDLSDQDALHRVLLEMQSHGTSYALIQNGIEVAKIVPVEKEIPVEWNRDKVSAEVTKKRWEVFAKVEEFSKEVAQKWSTDENSLEAITNDRERR